MQIYIDLVARKKCQCYRRASNVKASYGKTVRPEREKKDDHKWLPCRSTSPGMPDLALYPSQFGVIQTHLPYL